MFTAADHRHMARALELAYRGLYSCAPNPRVGCVLVSGRRVIGEGFHRRTGEPHAEVLALAAAREHARGATAYVTLEPCRHQGRTPPCTAALVEAGVARVVAAMVDPDPRVAGAGIAELRAAGVDARSGLMEAEARALNPGFLMRMERRRPLVRAKIAMTLDGRTATAGGESQWITGRPARRDVQHWRARSGAIVTGVGTVLSDDPRMTVRMHELERDAAAPEPPAVQPLRVVMDSSFRTPPGARLLAQEGPVLLVGTGDEHAARGRLAPRAEILRLEGRRPAPEAVLEALAGRGVNEVLVEAGARLTGSFAGAGLLDELVVYVAPALLGSRARPMLELPGIDRLASRMQLEILETRLFGDDLRLRLRAHTGADPDRGDADR